MNVSMDAYTTTLKGPAQTSKSAVDYQSFLKLLVAQMKNQDPTAPMESTDYVAQLATFSNVEQGIQTNTKLEQILQSQQLAQAGSIIGREITSADGKITGIVAEVKLTSEGAVAVLQDDKEVKVGPGVRIREAG